MHNVKICIKGVRETTCIQWHSMGADSVTIFETIGLIGGIFHVLGMFPQMYHMYQTQNVSGINLQFLSICILGSLCELVYLVHMGAWPSWVPSTFMVFAVYSR